MLQLYSVYLLWSRRKTLTGSMDPMHANGTNKPCTFDVWSLTKMLSPILSWSGFFVFFFLLFPSLAFLASLRLCATTRYSFDNSSILIMLSSVPRYFGLSDSSKLCFTAASLPNMRKNGAMPDDSVGKKLYAAVVFDTRLSHSTLFSNCLAIVAFKNLWNPSILPLHWGE